MVIESLGITLSQSILLKFTKIRSELYKQPAETLDSLFSKFFRKVFCKNKRFQSLIERLTLQDYFDLSGAPFI